MAHRLGILANFLMTDELCDEHDHMRLLWSPGPPQVSRHLDQPTRLAALISSIAGGFGDLEPNEIILGMN